MTGTRYADQAPKPRQRVIVQLHGETYPDGTPRQSQPVEYFPPFTTREGDGVGPRWGYHYETNDASGWKWERIHPDDAWRPADEPVTE